MESHGKSWKMKVPGLWQPCAYRLCAVWAPSGTVKLFKLITLNYLLGKGGYVFGSVGLFVCLPVDNITQKVMNRLR